jgi:hypothetical protein
MTTRTLTQEEKKAMQCDKLIKITDFLFFCLIDKNSKFGFVSKIKLASWHLDSEHIAFYNDTIANFLSNIGGFFSLFPTLQKANKI